MKKILSILLLTVPLFIFGQTQEEINKVLGEVSNKMNQNLPMVVDQYTTVKTTYGGMGKVMYIYQLDTDYFIDYGITQSQWLELQTELMTNTFCTDPSMKTFRDLKVDVIWKYLDLSGGFVGRIKLNYLDCYQ